MIDFNYQADFKLQNENEISQWISDIIEVENFDVGDILYVFCDDKFLHKLNMDYLNHDTFTDILSFDYSLENQISGEIYISIERVKENGITFTTAFLDELHRVMIHGIFHFCNYKDSSKSEKKIMRNKEDKALSSRQFL